MGDAERINRRERRNSYGAQILACAAQELPLSSCVCPRPPLVPPGTAPAGRRTTRHFTSAHTRSGQKALEMPQATAMWSRSDLESSEAGRDTVLRAAHFPLPEAATPAA